MAYMNQQKKKEIVTELKKVVPASWKYTLRVRHHSELVMTIRKGPAELLNGNEGRYNVNEYYPERSYDGELLETIKKIIDALNLNNFDNSDIMTDYFHVGHYIDLQIGEWDKPFVIS